MAAFMTRRLQIAHLLAAHRRGCGFGDRSRDRRRPLAVVAGHELDSNRALVLHFIAAVAITSQLVLAVFLVTQAYDGLFTYMAVNAYGVMAEGNLLLATWIDLIGAGPAILAAKLLAASCGVLLYCLGVRRALLGLTIFYALGAIGPWLIVLHRY